MKLSELSAADVAPAQSASNGLKLSQLAPEAVAAADSPALGDKISDGAMSVITGLGKGAAAGFGDRVGAGINAGIDQLTGSPNSLSTDYNTYLNRGRQAYAENETAHPVASRVGEFTSALATPMGEVSGAVGAAKVAGLGATQGLASAPDLSNATDDARRAAIGAGTGLALHGVVSGIASKLAPAAESLNNSADTNLVAGVLNPTKPQMANIQATGKMGSLSDAIQGAGAGKPWDTAAASSQKIGSALDDASAKLDALYANAHPNADEDLVTGTDLQNVVQQRIDALNNSGYGRGIARGLKQYLDDIKEAYGNGPLTLAQARDEVSGAQNLAFDGAGVNPGVAKQASQDLSMDMRQMLNGKIEEALPGADANAANKNVSNLITADNLANRNAAGAQSNRSFGLGDKIMSGVGAAVGSHAGPVGAVVGAAVGAGGSKLLRTFGKQTLAMGQRNLASAAEALAGQLDAGAPLADVIQRATAIGIPKAVVDQLSTQVPQQ